MGCLGILLTIGAFIINPFLGILFVLIALVRKIRK